jgi:hypothetical protein
VEDAEGRSLGGGGGLAVLVWADEAPGGAGQKALQKQDEEEEEEMLEVVEVVEVVEEVAEDDDDDVDERRPTVARVLTGKPAAASALRYPMK